MDHLDQGGEAMAMASEAAMMADFHTHQALNALDWYLIWANPKCEARALAGLRALGVAGYRPMLREVRVHYRSKKRVEVERPMFVRYIFAGIDTARGQTLAAVRECDGVEGLVSFAEDGAPLKVPADDLRRVINYEREAATGRRHAPVSFAIGDRIRIVAGPFSGIETVVSAYEARKGRLMADVEVLGGVRQVRVGVDSVRKRA
jgi:transcription antitermination factor NusG